MKIADRFADACYKYLKNYGRLIHYTYKYDAEPKWSISGLLHDMEQCLTEIRNIYNGKMPSKWGSKDVEHLIEMTEGAADKLFDIVQLYRSKYGDTY